MSESAVEEYVLHTRMGPASVTVTRPMFEILSDACVEGHHHHEECLIVEGARWPSPGISNDLEDDLI